MHDIYAQSLGLDTKPRNGDSVLWRELSDEDLIIAAVADGVGSLPCDWAASAQACRTLDEVFRGQDAGRGAAGLKARMAEAVRAAHRAVQGLSGRAAGGMTTLVFAVWPQRENRAWYVSIGDSRIYRAADDGAEILTVDDSIAVPLAPAGAGEVEYDHYLTKALGQPEPLEFAVQSTPFAPGDLLALASDGCHELPGFEDSLAAIQGHADLAEAVARTVNEEHAEEGWDDASLVLVRRSEHILV